MRAWLRYHIFDAAIVAAGIGLALALRISLLEFKSVDYFDYTKLWHSTLRAEGFAAFGRGFANYNVPYLYLLYAVVRFLPDLPAVIAIKIPSLVADFAAALLVFAVVRMRYRSSAFPLFSAFAVLFAPTLVLNSAFWGQADAVYACVLLASTYFMIRRQDAIAMLCYGLALALKAQAIFLLPLVLGLVLRREIRWRTLVLIPFIMLAVLVPALLAGRPLLELLLIYPSQAGQYEQLTMHAPTALAWIPDGGRYYPYFYTSALAVAATMALAFSWAIYRSSSKLTPGLLIELALISVILVPFFLPKMHERYFYLADLLSIVFAFYVPSHFFVPLLMITVSFFAYQPTLFGVEPVPMGLLALGVFILLVALLRHALARLFPSTSAT
ncbi:MAG: hypothetical protein V1755_10220 [Chloroflexota bacterium]